MNPQIEVLATKAAKWWTSFIERPVLQSDVNPDDSLDQPQRMIRDSMHDSCQAILFNRHVKQEKIPEFKRCLKERLVEEITYSYESHSVCIVSVDYDPCPVLAEVAQEVFGNSLKFILPEKTIMRIEPTGEIQVKLGYGASYERL